MPACSSVLLQTKFVLRMMAALALLIVPGACIANAQQGERPFVVDGLGRAIVPINGAWQFHTGDDLAWASPTFDDSSWKAIETGRPWEGQGYRDHTGFAWYRRRVVLRSDLVSGWDLAVSLSRVEDAAEVYWNGRRVGSYGKVPPNAVWYDNNHVPESMATILVLGAAADQARENVLAIRVWKAPYAYLSSPDMGGLTETPLLGNASALAAARTAVKYGWLHSNLYGLASVLVSSLVSLLALLTWWRDRRQWMLFWLAIYTLRPLALLLAEQLPGVTWRTGYGTVGMIYTSTDSALWFLLLYLLNLRENRRLV
ncbi:MAG TPA: beta galactosidase jelly roll domain-containing protein, partial [Terracidiphilus sp.]|nr:beta galactosidase jelly roll domain-containing protein [Terracidiphilus sp.]